MAFVDPDSAPSASASGFVDPDASPSRKTPKEMREPSMLQKVLEIERKAVSFTPLGPMRLIAEKGGELADKYSYEAGGRITDVTRSPAAGFATNIALQSIPALIGPGKAKIPAVALKDLVKLDTLKAAREIGLDVPPSAVGSGHIERGIESLGGKADIGREISSRNREAVQKAARKEAGIPEDQPITEATLSAARRQIEQPYLEVASISPTAKSALEQLKITREEAKGHWREFNGPNHPMAARKEAQRLDAEAEVYEKLIDEEAKKIGRPELLDALKAARVKLAKNHDVESALNVGTGEVDARMIGRMVDKRGTKAMTGELGTIGKFAQAFPDFVQPKDVARDVSALRPYAALLAGAGGYGVSEHYTGSPYGAVLAALPFISPVARSIALSKLMRSGALSEGASAERAAQASLIPLNELRTRLQP